MGAGYRRTLVLWDQGLGSGGLYCPVSSLYHLRTWGSEAGQGSAGGVGPSGFFSGSNVLEIDYLTLFSSRVYACV